MSANRFETIPDETARPDAAEEELSWAIVSSFDTHVAVLDRHGKIIAVNYAWNEFARDNDVRNVARVGAGINYLEVCRKALNNGDLQAQKALEGIKAVCEGSTQADTRDQAGAQSSPY